MERKRQGFLLATWLLVYLCLTESGEASPSPSLSLAVPRYRVANKEIHLKYGKLHPHHDARFDSDDDHVGYRWLGDDLVKTEGDFEGEEDDEYPTDRGKKVKLAGGCELTENQFLELESFKKETEYVKKCFCENGGVYCQINRALFKHHIG